MFRNFEVQSRTNGAAVSFLRDVFSSVGVSVHGIPVEEGCALRTSSTVETYTLLQVTSEKYDVSCCPHGWC